MTEMQGIHDDAPRASVRYTANFALNLEDIEAYWLDNGFIEGHDRLLTALSEVVVPNLERHPGMERLFLERAVDSVEAERISRRIASQLSALARDAQVREYVMDDYLVLYVHFHTQADPSSVVQLLAIKHQKQLGFDLLTRR